MGKRAKLEKFAEIGTMPNVFQNFDYQDVALVNHHGVKIDFTGRWCNHYFPNNHPIVIELGCGSGSYTLGLSGLDESKNYIGVDIKGNRLWTGAKIALQKELKNVAFIRSRIEFLDRFFGPQELSEIWITFPDPFKKRGQENRRMTSPFFLEMYSKLLMPGSHVHLKTDSSEFYEYSKKVMAKSKLGYIQESLDNLYAQPHLPEELLLKTKYEVEHLKEGRIIKYLRFQIN